MPHCPMMFGSKYFRNCMLIECLMLFKCVLINCVLPWELYIHVIKVKNPYLTFRVLFFFLLICLSVFLFCFVFWENIELDKEETAFPDPRNGKNKNKQTSDSWHVSVGGFWPTYRDLVKITLTLTQWHGIIVIAANVAFGATLSWIHGAL